MALTSLVFVTLAIVLAIYDGIVVYVVPMIRQGKPGVDMSISRFLQMLPTRSPFVLLAIGVIAGHVFGWMPCKECPPEIHPQAVMAAIPAHDHDHDHAGHHPRSPEWPAVRAAYLKDHPTCEACGTSEDLQVHHVQAFEFRPELELDPSNLITLCGPGKHNCHEHFGHLDNYKCENPHVREDAAAHLRRVQERQCNDDLKPVPETEPIPIRPRKRKAA